jgi:hypothetical protein
MKMFFTTVLIFFLIFTLLLLIIISSALLGFVMTRVPFIRTPSRDIDEIIRLGNIGEGDVVYDLGSGDGKMVFALTKTTGARGVGFEQTHWTHLLAQIKNKFLGNRNLFLRDNFFDHSWDGANVIYCYLYPPLMRQVGDKIKADCKPGTRVVVRDFPIPNLEQQGYYRDGKHELFLYII